MTPSTDRPQEAQEPMDGSDLPSSATPTGASSPAWFASSLERAAPVEPVRRARRGGTGRAARIAGSAALVLVIAAFSFSVGVGADRAGILGAVPTAVPTAAAPSGLPSEFGLLGEAWRLLKEHYVDQSALKAQELGYGAVKGMVEAVGDTSHTRFLTPEELKAQRAGLSGEISGIGATMTVIDEQPGIQSVIPGSPADKAGLRGGDRLVEVDGWITAGHTIDEVVSRVRGPEGSTVRLKIARSGAEDFEVSIVRAKIQIPAVSWTMVPGSTTALVRLEQFQSRAGDQLVEALKEARGAGATAVVLDLRENPGGYVNEAVRIASQFLKDGVVYISRDGKGKETPSEVESGGVATDLPLAVLVNAGSASSSEIVAGALQDAGRATIVGTRTFGTGTVLSQYDLPDGSALLIGTVEWLTPKGNQIWRKGITPDVAVDLPQGGTILSPGDVSKLDPEGLQKSADAQLLKALEVLANKS